MRPTRRHSRRAPSGATSVRTRAVRTVSPTGSPPRTCWPSTWCSPTVPRPGSAASSPTRGYAARLLRGLGRHDGHRHRGRGSPHARPPVCGHDVVRVRRLRGGRRHRERRHRGRCAAGHARDDGRPHHPRRRGLRRSRVSTRRAGPGCSRRSTGSKAVWRNRSRRSP